MKLENYGDWNCINCPDCENGQHQSPVNITDVQASGRRPLTFDYRPLPLTATDTGQNIRFDDRTGQNSVIYEDVRYTLMQFHFHHPGEHQINHQAYAMELHLVHWQAEQGFLVIAVMIERGDTPRPAYAALWVQLPGTDAPSNATLNPADLLPAAHDYYAYYGSLTTQPCSENVQWVIMSEPVTLAAEQLDTYQALYTGNNRPLQPLNGRPIFRYTED